MPPRSPTSGSLTSGSLTSDSLTPLYFDDVYAANPDPWSFETSGYERAKYAATLAALPRARYERAFEIGCSIGVLTEQLAARCKHLLAVDVAHAALARARQRCADLPQVVLQCMHFPQELPGELPGQSPGESPGELSGELPRNDFDLILLSEVGYYWCMDDLQHALDWMFQAVRSGGHLVLVHWTPVVADYPLTGDDVHDITSRRARAQGWHPLHSQRFASYRIDVLEAP